MANKSKNGADSVATLRAAAIGKVDVAIKLRTESAPALYAGFAAAWFWGVSQGDLGLLNKLYLGLPEVDQNGLRTIAINQAHDLFTPDSDKDKDGKPYYRYPLVRFMSKANDEGLHFAWRVSSNKTPADIESYEKANGAGSWEKAMALRQTMKEAGEEMFAFAWSKPGMARQDSDFSIGDAGAQIRRVFEKAAKAGYLNKASVEAFTRAAPEALFGLSDAYKVFDAIEAAEKAKRKASLATPPVKEADKPEAEPEMTETEIPAGHPAMQEQAAA